MLLKEKLIIYPPKMPKFANNEWSHMDNRGLFRVAIWPNKVVRWTSRVARGTNVVAKWTIKAAQGAAVLRGPMRTKKGLRAAWGGAKGGLGKVFWGHITIGGALLFLHWLHNYHFFGAPFIGGDYQHFGAQLITS